ncbi:MAG: aldehyde oxidoreductase [Desulfotalea sp.]|nr:MAG: aldehyde oxidoreductase [Desulfotalea sp.]
MTHTPIDGLATIPRLGLGTWKSKRGEVGAAITAALDIGYRHFDCASIYNNEKEIGTALSAAISTGTVRREQLWISSKLWNNAHAAKHVRPALERTLKNLQLDHLDLYLIHWPVSFKADITFPKRPEQFIAAADLPIIETWRAMEKMVKKGLCRHIGVCNFNTRRLIELEENGSQKPYTNQIELHPFLQQPQMIKYCAKSSIQLTAYSPLGSGKAPQREDLKATVSLLNHPKIVNLALKKQATPAQILIAWALTRQTIVIPKSIHHARLMENFQAQHITISTNEMMDLCQIDLGHRFLDGSFFAPPGSPYTVNNLWDES